MAKEITTDNPVMILIVATSSGEVDWILPVLKTFLDKHPDWRLISLFGHKIVFDRFRITNPVLFQIFSEISSLNIVPQEINNLFSNYISSQQVKILFKDFNRDEFAPYKNMIERECPEALIVSYPHSCHIYSRMGKDPVSHCENPDAFSRHDLFLLGSENDIPQWSKSVDERKVSALGYPRYDSQWVDRFLSDPILKSSEEFRQAQNADKVFFYISRSAHPQYLSQEDYEYLIRSTAEVVFGYENSLLLIKPHPRQDIKELFQLLEPYSNGRYLVSGLHLFQLSHISNLVISGWSSGILDALAVGKPVIEFWKFGGKDPNCRRSANGDYTTIYRELGLARPAETKEDLKDLIKKFYDEPDGVAWTDQKRSFAKYCKFTDQASQNIVDAIERALTVRSDPKEVVNVKSNDEKIHPPEPLIETMIEFIASLVSCGQNAKAKSWLEFMDAQFPEDVQVLNNHAIFLFNAGDVNAAVDKLIKCIELNLSYWEAAINLIQILLVIDRVDDALNIIVKYQLQKQTKAGEKSFLHTLSEQLTEEQFEIVYRGVAQMLS